MRQQPIGANKPLEEVTVREAWKELHQQEQSEMSAAPMLLDVREVYEFVEGHAQGAINIPLSEFRERYQEAPRDREILCICHMGSRSAQAGTFLLRQGWTHVKNVAGGTDEWEAAGLPMERGR